MRRLNLIWPMALNVSQNSQDFAVGQHLIEGRHQAHATYFCWQPGSAKADGLNQQLIRMVPGVPSRIVRRSPKRAIRIWFFPL